MSTDHTFRMQSFKALTGGRLSVHGPFIEVVATLTPDARRDAVISLLGSMNESEIHSLMREEFPEVLNAERA